MNKTKRNLIMAGAIVNLISTALSLTFSIIAYVNPNWYNAYAGVSYVLTYSVSLVYCILSFGVGIAGSIMLLYSIREKGKHFRTSQGLYIAGFVIVVLCGGTISWVLLFISLFIPDVVVMNTKSEIKQEEKEEEKKEQIKEQQLEEKKQKIEELKKMRDNGEITEEEYKEKLFELL